MKADRITILETEGTQQHSCRVHYKAWSGLSWGPVKSTLGELLTSKLIIKNVPSPKRLMTIFPLTLRALVTYWRRYPEPMAEQNLLIKKTNASEET